MAFMNDSDEEQEDDEDMLLACILVGEYLEEKRENCLGTTKMENLAPAYSVRLKNVGKLFMCITRLHNFCINEGCVNIVNADDNFEN